jgi:hypothetical protein
MDTDKTEGVITKIAALLALMLMPMILFSCATAEREHVQSGPFDISFEMNNAHEVGYIDNGIKIKTSEGNVKVEMIKDESGLSPSEYDQWAAKIFSLAGSKVESLRIDGENGKVMAGKTEGYTAYYRPVDGYYAFIECSLPPMETTFFLKGLKIEPESYAKNAITYPGSNDLTINQTNQEDAIRAAEMEIENSHSIIATNGLSEYWTRVGDTLWRENKTAAAIDAYNIALDFTPSQERARSHKSLVESGTKAPQNQYSPVAISDKSKVLLG